MNDILSTVQPPVPPAQAEAQPKPKPKKKRRPSGPVPSLVDMAIQVFKILIVIVGVATTVISVMSGATPIWAMIRGGLSMLALGFLAWIALWLLASGALETARIELLQQLEEAKANATEEVASTIEKEA